MIKEKIIVALYPGCISFEVALAAELLSKKYEVLNATPDGNDLEEVSGLPLKTHLSYSEVDLNNCKAILVPGGDPRSLVQNTEIDRILREANLAGLLIGGICAGPSVLAKAGILKGRTIAHGYGREQLEYLKDLFEGVILTDEAFAVDHNIVTAKPEAYIDFAVEIGCRLDVIDASKSGRIKEYYRGTLGRKIRPIALALMKNERKQYLLHKAYDSVTKENFYRPLGGGIEFHETGKIALEREFLEEIGRSISVKSQVACLENLFSYEGKRGHEMVMLYETQFLDPEDYKLEEMDVVESGKVIAQAVWRSIEEIKGEKAKLYPLGLEEVINTFN